MAKQSQEVPWWVKSALYIALPLVAVYLAYKIVEGLFLGGINAIKDVTTKMIEEYVKKVKDFSDATDGQFTPSQIAAMNKEEENIRFGVQSMAQLGLVNQIGGLILFAIVGACGVLGVKAIIDWKLRAQGNMGTAHAMRIIVACTLADEMAAGGNLLAASTIRAFLETGWITEQASMATELAYYQDLITQGITGWELAYAQYMVQMLPIEIAIIPTWIALLPPPPI